MALHLVDLKYRYRRDFALDSISLRIESGEGCGLIGHNGAGKTTTLRLILGLLRPRPGEVWVDGFDARERSSEARARLGGLIEVPGFDAGVSGEKQLLRLGRLAGWDRRRSREEVARVLRWVGLEVHGSRTVRRYSQGMRQRLGIAQALLGNPRYVLLDEPTNGLDPEGIAEIRDLIRRLQREEGLGVLVSSHRLREIDSVCEKIAVLREGKLVLEGAMRDLATRSGHRYRLETENDEAAARLLAGSGIEARRHSESGLEFGLDGLAPPDLLARLVGGGTRILRFAPQDPTLEEIYLGATRDVSSSELVTESGSVAREAPDSTSHRAPFPILRTLRYEIGRSLGWGRWMLFSLPSGCGIAAVVQRWLEARSDRENLEARDLFSATDVTAFEGMAVGLGAGIPVAVLILAALSSQSVSGEMHRGTLRTLLTRSLGRTHLGLGKISALGLLGLGIYLGTCLVVGSVSALAFDFVGVTEILPNGERFPLVSAEELWPAFGKAIALPLFPVIGGAAVGFMIGTWVRSGAMALGLTLGFLAVSDLGRVMVRGTALESALLSAYFPSPFGDDSAVRGLRELAQGASNAVDPSLSLALIVPGLWVVASVVVSLWVMGRRAIP